MFISLILFLTVYWLLSFFGNSIVPVILLAHGLTDMLAVVIILLIMICFLT